jgi:hypothetical protein
VYYLAGCNAASPTDITEILGECTNSVFRVGDGRAKNKQQAWFNIEDGGSASLKI